MTQSYFVRIGIDDLGAERDTSTVWIDLRSILRTGSGKGKEVVNKK